MCLAAAASADPNSIPLQQAREHVARALDTPTPQDRQARLAQAANHYQLALQDPSLPAPQRDQAHQALLAIRSLQAKPTTPNPPMASPSLPAPLHDTFQVAHAAWQTHPGQTELQAGLREALLAGQNPHGAVGPGLLTPNLGTTAAHTLAAVLALQHLDALTPDSIQRLTHSLLQQQAPDGGWTNPLSPANPNPRPSDPATTAFQLLILQTLQQSPHLAGPQKNDVQHAVRSGLMFLKSAPNPASTSTIRQAAAQHARAALGLPHTTPHPTLPSHPLLKLLQQTHPLPSNATQLPLNADP